MTTAANVGRTYFQNSLRTGSVIEIFSRADDKTTSFYFSKAYRIPVPFGFTNEKKAPSLKNGALFVYTVF